MPLGPQATSGPAPAFALSIPSTQPRPVIHPCSFGTTIAGLSRRPRNRMRPVKLQRFGTESQEISAPGGVRGWHGPSWLCPFSPVLSAHLDERAVPHSRLHGHVGGEGGIREGALQPHTAGTAIGTVLSRQGTQGRSQAGSPNSSHFAPHSSSLLDFVSPLGDPKGSQFHTVTHACSPTSLRCIQDTLWVKPIYHQEDD